MTRIHTRALPLSPRGAAPTVGAVGRAARERAAHPGLAWLRMLLLVSLLLGVASMHTLGHASKNAETASPVFTASVVAHAAPLPGAHAAPVAEGHAAPGAGARTGPVADAVPASDAHAAPDAQAVPGAHVASDSHAATGPQAALDAQASSDSHAASPVTDPTTMCLAVAALVAALVGLAAAVFVPWPGPLLRPPSSLLRWVVRVAPPEPPSLAKLQVLRV